MENHFSLIIDIYYIVFKAQYNTKMSLLVTMSNALSENYQYAMHAPMKIAGLFYILLSDIGDLARMCNVSPIYFRKLFTEYAGVTPMQYIKYERENNR